MLNQQHASWDERLKIIHRLFPSTDRLDWKRAFDADITLMGRILRDIAKTDQPPQNRPGPRPGLDPYGPQPLVDSWVGTENGNRPYTVLPFADAFRQLAAGRSRTSLARMVGLDRVMVHRLLAATVAPTGEIMEKVAAAFGKRPSYFLEYRLGFISQVIFNSLATSPEKSIRLYEQVVSLMDAKS